MEHKAYVSNLPFSISEDELRDFFAAMNPTSVNIITERDTGRSRGFGFVEFGSEEDLKNAIELNDNEIGGRQLRISKAHARKDR